MSVFKSIVNRAASHKLTQIIFWHFIRTVSLRKASAEMHSNPVTHDYSSFQVQVLPALSDNYMYLLIDKTTNEAAIVDPVDPDTVILATEEKNLSLTTVLTTHHHWDHAGGNSDLVKQMTGTTLRVIAGDSRVPSLSKKVIDNEEFKVGSLLIKALHTPCHTTGHMCYYVTSPTASTPIVFTGDTLFVAGCGRFFEGTASEMDIALNTKLANLPNDTRVYCGHEYTKTNLKFAQAVEPNNEDIKKKLEHVINLRDAKEPTVPSTIDEEKKTNPFMRIGTDSVKKYANMDDLVKVMQVIRDKKNDFKG